MPLFVIDRASAVTGKSGGAHKQINNDIVKQSKAAKETDIVFDANNCINEWWFEMPCNEMVAEVGNAIK